jgi:tRNA (guanine37-N1)-methyltransferase
MRIDVVTIFPDYLAPLRLSLLGRARDEGLLSIDVHDLRDWTHDRHRTVDDTPYGGGAGMVMRPEPWGEVLDDLLAQHDATPTVVFPSPAGVPFTQRIAERLSGAPWLLFAAGRYEGIDQRVVDHYRERVAVEELSVGDYILNGGEVAIIAMIEAIARLLPGFMGNPDSLTEESHHTSPDGALLEYPVYTKPPSWRGLDVPDVLLSGHHARITRWRRDQSLRRTAERRPDLLAAAEPGLVARDRDALDGKD